MWRFLSGCEPPPVIMKMGRNPAETTKKNKRSQTFQTFGWIKGRPWLVYEEDTMSFVLLTIIINFDN